MEWALAAVAGLGIYLLGRYQGWWGVKSGPIVADLESDMPDALKQAVLAQLASQKDPLQLLALAKTMTEAGYIQSAYALQQRAWVLGGNVGAPPTHPTPAQIAAAQAMRAALKASGGGTVTPAGGLPTATQIMLSPGLFTTLTANVGDTIGITGAAMYTSAAGGFVVQADPKVATQMTPDGTTWALVGPGVFTVMWGPNSTTTVTVAAAAASTTATAAAAVAAASPTPATTTAGTGPGEHSEQVNGVRSEMK